MTRADAQHVVGVEAADALNAAALASGIYAPLRGFCGSGETDAILSTWRTPEGRPWPLPILLPADTPARPGERVVLTLGDVGVAAVDVRERFRVELSSLARGTFGTDDRAHPGVAAMLRRPDTFVAGPVQLLDPRLAPFPGPEETRAAFRARGWQTVAGFQTRNPPHRGHERLVKAALGLVDGVLVHPLVGPRKAGDAVAEVVLDAWTAVLDAYLPKPRVHLAPLRLPMMYAGAREAIHHAIVRRNFGCTHFVVGRDHAGTGVGGEDDAIEAFARFPDLGIDPIPARGAYFHCRACGDLETERTCPHDEAARLRVSGTQLREWRRLGATPPTEVVRPEAWRALAKHPSPFLE